MVAGWGIASVRFRLPQEWKIKLPREGNFRLIQDGDTGLLQDEDDLLQDQDDRLLQEGNPRLRREQDHSLLQKGQETYAWAPIQPVAPMHVLGQSGGLAARLRILGGSFERFRGNLCCYDSLR